MGQISYTLNFKLGKPNKKGLSTVYIRYYSTEHDIMIPSSVKVSDNEIDTSKTKSPVTKHPNAKQYNLSLDTLKIEIDSRAIKASAVISKEYLEGRAGSSDRVVDFIEDFVTTQRKENERCHDTTARGVKRAKGRFSEGRLRIYMVLRNKLLNYDKRASFNKISIEWLKGLESCIRKTDVGQNTLSSNMTVFKALLGHAQNKGLLSKEQYEKYIPPVYIQEIPEYLIEQEIESFLQITRNILDEEIKTCGYYFLLGCYAGYRISDLMSFDYSKMVKGDQIILRASKNGKIVSIGIYDQLREILDYCKSHKITLTEEHFRKKVKVIATLSGISGRNIKVHTARHTFGMMMTNRGLNIREVADLLGDSEEVAKLYARISPTQLNRRVREVMSI